MIRCFIVNHDVGFSVSVSNLHTSGTYGGNDALVAFARHHRLNIYIHQVDSPVWTVSTIQQLLLFPVID